MSDDTSPVAVPRSSELGSETLSNEAIESILADFRSWLETARDRDMSAEADLAAPGFDVASVLQHFVALRQEINLQTKASRNQLEQNAQTLAALQEAVSALEHQEARREGVQSEERDEALRPLLKTLIEAHDSLALAQRQVQRLLETSPGPDAIETTPSAPGPPVIKLKIPHWARWIGLDASVEAQLAPLYAWHRAQASRSTTPETASFDRYRQSLEALLTGYRMGMQRIERAIVNNGLEPIPSVGMPFDPEIMEVAEVVREEGRAKTEVIDELRPGYRWRGRLFRCAQVRVAKP